MKIDLHVDTDNLPDDVIVIERSKGPQGWVIRARVNGPIGHPRCTGGWTWLSSTRAKSQPAGPPR